MVSCVKGTGPMCQANGFRLDSARTLVVGFATTMGLKINGRSHQIANIPLFRPIGRGDGRGRDRGMDRSGDLPLQRAIRAMCRNDGARVQIGRSMLIQIEE
jgi:hypothetical protein